MAAATEYAAMLRDGGFRRLLSMRAVHEARLAPRPLALSADLI
jgi:hypothetical protein